MVVSMTGAQPSGAREVIALTAAKTIGAGDYGKVFTNRGASGSVTVTLSAAADAKFQTVSFRVVAAQAMVIKSAAAAKMVTVNDATASSVTLPTTAIGGGVDCFSDGTSWIATPIGFVASATAGAATGPTIA